MRLQLQSILLPDTEICDVEELYFHKTEDEVLFDGYFNLFYIEKRKAYTTIDNLSLQLTLQGYDELIIMHDEKPIGTVELDAEEEKEYIIELPYAEYDKGVFWFRLRPAKKADKSANIGSISESETCPCPVSGFYITDISADKLRPINIGIDICTYKREEYVIRNLNQIKDRILFNRKLDAASHYSIYVVDNGKTLQDYPEIATLKEECGEKLKVIPNKNSGGAGGFTRGMLEILDDKKKLGLTHVLVMDDDATYEPDSFVRLYGLLTTLKDEWKDITVGGAMLRDDFPHVLYCAGEYWKSAYICNDMMNADLRFFEDATAPLLTETGHEYEWYSGWWLCCYSLNTVREDNLPVPFFLHHDDMEFGIRNQEQGIVFLNGICVWHGKPDQTYLGNNVYYDVRNNLAEIALHEKEDRQCTVAAKYLLRSITASAIKMRYEDAQLEYQGFLDFFKGPEWLCRQDPEKLNLKVRSSGVKMEPVDKVLTRLSDRDRKAVEKQLAEYDRVNANGETLKRKRSRTGKLFQMVTYNGWILPADKKEIKVVSSADSPFEGFRKERILMYEPGSGKAAIAVRDWGEMKKILGIYRKMAAIFIRYFKRACKNWRKNVGKITNKKAWEKYLEEDYESSPEGGTT